MPSFRYLTRHADLEKIPIRYVPKSHRPMSEAEHVEHAKKVFEAWYEKAKEHMPDDLQRGAEWLLEHAERWRHTMYMVDVMAETCRLYWKSERVHN